MIYSFVKVVVVWEKGKPVLYLHVTRAIYGLLQSALLWYKTFRKDLEEIGFDFNPYDACVACRDVDGDPHAIRFHVDDIMSSHAKAQVNSDFIDWLNMKYGQHAPIKATTGKIHKYLGMIFDFSVDGEVRIDMRDYIKKFREFGKMLFLMNASGNHPR